MRIYVEGGGDSGLDARCREGFRKLLENSGFTGRIPRIVACGSRNEAYSDFKTALGSKKIDYAFLIVDSEDAVADIDKPWEHLTKRDGWVRPAKAEDEQVFLMTTCMETWVVADRAALKEHYGAKLHDSALPPAVKLEERDRHTEIQDKLLNATRDCTNKYKKNKRSFEVLAAVDPATLKKLLPSFKRMIDLLEAKL